MRRAGAILVFIAAVSFALSPIVSGGFGGFAPDRYPVPQVDPPVQPVAWAFSIWAPIYLWLIAHAGFGLFARADATDWQAARGPLFISLAIGTFWIPIARISPIWATILIWAMLVSAVVALVRSPARDRWLAASPVGLYAGWLTAASFVSLGLLSAGYGVLAAVPSALAAILGALVFSAAILLRRPETAYAAGVIWALIGIVAAQGPTRVTVIAALGCALIAALTWNRARAAP